MTASARVGATATSTVVTAIKPVTDAHPIGPSVGGSAIAMVTAAARQTAARASIVSIVGFDPCCIRATTMQRTPEPANRSTSARPAVRDNPLEDVPAADSRRYPRISRLMIGDAGNLRDG
jgi:hypothetical protein